MSRREARVAELYKFLDESARQKMVIVGVADYDWDRSWIIFFDDTEPGYIDRARAIHKQLGLTGRFWFRRGPHAALGAALRTVDNVYIAGGRYTFNDTFARVTTEMSFLTMESNDTFPTARYKMDGAYNQDQTVRAMFSRANARGAGLIGGGRFVRDGIWYALIESESDYENASYIIGQKNIGHFPVNVVPISTLTNITANAANIKGLTFTGSASMNFCNGFTFFNGRNRHFTKLLEVFQAKTDQEKETIYETIIGRI